MARLDRLCSEDDNNDELWSEQEHEHQEKLFKWVVSLDPNLPLC